MRCLVLANELQRDGWQCYFVTNQASYDFIPLLQKFSRIDPKEFWEKPLHHQLMVADNYDLDQNYEKHFRNYAERILVLDDLANRQHNCDILVDQNLGSKVEDYKNLVNKDCQILVGTSYCLLRPEFVELRPKALQKRENTTKINNILVNFGGSDVKNHNLKALQTVEESNFVGNVDVVLGFNSIHFNSIAEFAKTSKNKITIHRQANMAELIYKADLAIAAGGTSAWERCCLGLPTYIVKIADNQEKIFNALGVKESFNEFMSEIENNYWEYCKNISSYVDGAGSKRLINIILLHHTNK